VISSDRVPEGFEVRELPHGALIVVSSRVEKFLEAGLGDPHRWEELTGSGATTAAGRGRASRFDLPGGEAVLIKKMRRGGLAGPLWNDRYPGTRRLLQNLRVPLEARRRGVATPAPRALLVLRGPGCLAGGWLAVEWIEDSADLAARYEGDEPPSTGELAAAMGLVRRMHDAGVQHRDLNLGNLVLRTRPDAAPEPFVIDLDRARLHGGELSFRLRQQALRRLERSYVKVCGDRAEQGTIGFGPWYELYAGDDAGMLDRLKRGSTAGRLRLALHRLTWR
jgi:3-deoxy-D-manno-octulosonic acid kinase